MDRRNAQVFEVEMTDLDESIDVSAPTVVLSAAPLQPCVRASAPTVRHVAPGRLPGKPLCQQPAPRQAQEWAIEVPWETAPVGSIPMPGERASGAMTQVPRPVTVDGGERHSAQALTILQRAAPIGVTPMPDERANAAVTRVQQVPRSVAAHADERPSAHALTIVQRARAEERPSAHALTIVQRAPLAIRACEPPVQYSVEREVSAMAPPRRAMPHKGRRSGHILVLIIGMLAGFMTVLSIVVVRQQSELQETVEPAHRANEACMAYAAEVDAIALELTRAVGNVADVEKRVGQRARSVVNDRGLQSVCIGRIEARCAGGDAACVAAAVMELRQALARR